MAPRDKTACQTFPCKCKICISSIESDVYNKKKIQMFVVNMTFISSREVKKCIFHSCLRHSWNIHFFTSLDEIKVIFTPNIWISSIYYVKRIITIIKLPPLTISSLCKKDNNNVIQLPPLILKIGRKYAETCCECGLSLQRGLRVSFLHDIDFVFSKNTWKYYFVTALWLFFFSLSLFYSINRNQ